MCQLKDGAVKVGAGWAINGPSALLRLELMLGMIVLSYTMYPVLSKSS